MGKTTFIKKIVIFGCLLLLIPISGTIMGQNVFFKPSVDICLLPETPDFVWHEEVTVRGHIVGIKNMPGYSHAWLQCIATMETEDGKNFPIYVGDYNSQQDFRTNVACYIFNEALTSKTSVVTVRGEAGAVDSFYTKQGLHTVRVMSVTTDRCHTDFQLDGPSALIGDDLEDLKTIKGKEIKKVLTWPNLENPNAVCSLLVLTDDEKYSWVHIKENSGRTKVDALAACQTALTIQNLKLDFEVQGYVKYSGNTKYPGMIDITYIGTK